MKQEMIRCDNPNCSSVTKEIYGWITGTLAITGPGPTVYVEVCSSECLELGFDAVIEMKRYIEEAEAEAWGDLVQSKALSIECSVCGSGPGEGCITRPGNTAQRPHASRLDEGRRLAHEEMKENNDESETRSS